MTTPNDIDLDAIEARANAATPGPWRWGPGTWEEREEEPNGWDDKLYATDGAVLSDGSARGEYSPDIDVRSPDAEFIAAARTDVPALCRALRERDAEIARLREDAARLDWIAANAGNVMVHTSFEDGVAFHWAARVDRSAEWTRRLTLREAIDAALAGEAPHLLTPRATDA